MVHLLQLLKGGIAGFWLVEKQVFLPLSNFAETEQLPEVAKRRLEHRILCIVSEQLGLLLVVVTGRAAPSILILLSRGYEAGDIVW